MSLTSVATRIWNEIAEGQQLKTQWAKKAFLLSPDEMAELEDLEYKELVKKYPHEVAAAFLDMKPLLLENVAISRHIQRTNSLELRNALPEVTTINEAVMLASLDRMLTRSQQKQLTELLKAEVS